MYRFFSEEAKKQQNIESITAKALPELAEAATPERLEDDWITNFFASAGSFQMKRCRYYGLRY